MRATPILRTAVVVAASTLLLTSCSEQPATVVPTKVLEQDNVVTFGRTDEAQRILRKSADMANAAWRDTGTLDISSDYLNVRDGEVTFTETWPASRGVGVMHLVSVYPSPERLVLASKDRDGVCWYSELTLRQGAPVVRFGVSIDSSCRADNVDQADARWQESTFPMRPQGTAPAQGTSNPQPANPQTN